MEMTEAIQEALKMRGFEVDEGDGPAVLDFLVKNVDSEGAQMFRKEVSDHRRRAYMAEHMRQKRAAMARGQETQEWTEDSYRAAVGAGLKAYARSARVALGHEMALVEQGYRDGLVPAKVAEAIVAYREKHQ